MVATGDLKSPDLNSRVGSSPTPSTKQKAPLYLRKIKLSYLATQAFCLSLLCSSA